MNPAGRAPRNTLTRERVVEAAVGLADADGVPALTIRSLAARLGVKPMAIYHHVPNKDAILDGIVEHAFGLIELPRPGGDWRAELRRRCASAREVLRAHPWALMLLESRTSPSAAGLAQYDAVIGTLREAGFSLDATAQAFALLDSYVHGFVLQEIAIPIDSREENAPLAEEMAAAVPPDLFPYLAEFAAGVMLRPGYRFADEFDRGLDFVLDGLERLLR